METDVSSFFLSFFCLIHVFFIIRTVTEVQSLRNFFYFLFFFQASGALQRFAWTEDSSRRSKRTKY